MGPLVCGRGAASERRVGAPQPLFLEQLQLPLFLPEWVEPEADKAEPAETAVVIDLVEPDERPDQAERLQPL